MIHRPVSSPESACYNRISTRYPKPALTPQARPQSLAVFASTCSKHEASPTFIPLPLVHRRCQPRKSRAIRRGSRAVHTNQHHLRSSLLFPRPSNQQRRRIPRSSPRPSSRTNTACLPSSGTLRQPTPGPSDARSLLRSQPIPRRPASETLRHDPPF